MKNITTVVLIFGGKSAEHEISIISAQNVSQAFDNQKFSVIPVGISKNNEWFHFKDKKQLNTLKTLNDKHPTMEPAVLLPANSDGPRLLCPETGKIIYFDVAFPLLHGPLGEDGTIQGLLRLYDIPFVGCDVLGSALCMDKEVMKRLLIEANLPTAKYELLLSHEKEKISFENLQKKLGLPFFIKPANMGSSVGVHKIKDPNDFATKIEDAFRYDSKVIAETFIKGREIECSVLGNESPKASLPGEIIPQHDFYSYNAKYLDDHGALLEVPAKIPGHLTEKVRKLAIDTFISLYCTGMARVDFFLTADEEIYINEVNTIPGFTKISMYPKLWSVTGLGYSDLVAKLVELAIDRHHKLKCLSTDFVNK